LVKPAGRWKNTVFHSAFPRPSDEARSIRLINRTGAADKSQAEQKDGSQPNMEMKGIK
jgi:hypothetical protein